MAKFDSNLWYHIYMDSDKGNALVGTSLFNEEWGATFFQPTDLTKTVQKWQFYAVDTSPTYVIRSMDADGIGCMGAQYNETTKETLAVMMGVGKADDTVYWTIWESKPAGTYYLTNKANGTAQRFSTKVTETRMSDDTTGENPGQQLAFEPIEAINNEKFSQVNLRTKVLISPATSSTSFTTPSTIPTPSITPSPTPPGTANTPATNPSSGGLSTPAKAAIGASVGGIALIALVILGLFFRRRRKSPQTSYHQTNHEAYQEVISETDHFVKAELATNNDSTTKQKRFYVKPELAANEESTVAHELPLTHAPPAELPVEAVRNGLLERR